MRSLGFEEMFDWWLAEHFAKLANDGYGQDLLKVEAQMIMNDFAEAIPDCPDLKKKIKKKLEQTVELFYY